MKKMLIALLVSSVAFTAMARYGIYSIVMNGQYLDMRDDGGKYIYNGEVEETFPFVYATDGKLEGFIVEDEYDGEYFLFFKEEGKWMQVPISVSQQLWYTNISIYKESGQHWKSREKGMVSMVLYMDLGDMYLQVTLLGNYSSSEKSRGKDVSSWKYDLIAQGAGQGEMTLGDMYAVTDMAMVDKGAYTTGVVVTDARLRYNNKVSHKVDDVYDDVMDGEGSETEAIAAVEDWLEKWLGGDAEPDLSDD